MVLTHFRAAIGRIFFRHPCLDLMNAGWARIREKTPLPGQSHWIHRYARLYIFGCLSAAQLGAHVDGFAFRIVLDACERFFVRSEVSGEGSIQIHGCSFVTFALGGRAHDNDQDLLGIPFCQGNDVVPSRTEKSRLEAPGFRESVSAVRYENRPPCRQ